MPESELETELVTADASYHLHKIVQTVRSLEELEKLELTSRSSTCCLGSPSNGQVAWPKEIWQHCQTVEKKQSSSTQIDASMIHAIFVIRLKGPRLSGSNPIDGLSSQPLNYVHNSTSPTTIKERSTIPARMSCYLECHVNGCGLSLELH